MSALSLLKAMIVFQPHQRISAVNALAHKFVEDYHDAHDEPIATQRITLQYDDDTHFRPHEWRQIILASVQGSFDLCSQVRSDKIPSRIPSPFAPTGDLSWEVYLIQLQELHELSLHLHANIHDSALFASTPAIVASHSCTIISRMKVLLSLHLSPC